MRKLAHVRSVGFGNPIWSYPRYVIPGVSPSHSIYDHPELEGSEGNDVRIRGGVETHHARQPTQEPTTTRNPRIGAQFSSLAAMPIFQSGWSTSWAHLQPLRVALEEGRQLNTNFNPNAPGSKEQQRATAYNPWPSAGALYPKAI